jgi:hypothetical protein
MTRLGGILLSPGRNDLVDIESVIMRTLGHLYLEFEAI